MPRSGLDEASVARDVCDTWIGAISSVAETDAEAGGSPSPFRIQAGFRQAMRRRIYEEQGVLLQAGDHPAARSDPRHSLLCGSPATVAEAIAETLTRSAWGLILVFRIGPMPYEVAEAESMLCSWRRSLRSSRARRR